MITENTIQKLNRKQEQFRRGESLNRKWEGFDPRSSATIIEDKSIQRSVFLSYCSVAGNDLDLSSCRGLEIGVEKHRNVCLLLGMREWERLDRLEDIGGNKTDYMFDFSEEDIPAELIGAFGVVVCSNVLEHTFDVLTGFDRVFSFARPGGLVVFSTPFKIGVHGTPDYWRMTPQVYERVIPKFSDNYCILEEVYSNVLHGVSCFAEKK